MPQNTETDPVETRLLRRIALTEKAVGKAADVPARRKARGKLHELRSVLAWHYLKQEEFEKAAPLLDALPRAAYEWDRTQGKARILIETGRLRKARNLLEAYISRHPKDPRGFAVLGGLLVRQGEPFEALRHYQRAHELAPDLPLATENLARLFRMLEYHEEEYRLWSGLVQADPQNSEYRFERANCQILRENFREAIEELRELLAGNHRTEKVYLALSMACRKLGCDHEEYQTALEGLRHCKESPELHALAGLGQIRIGKFEEARKTLEAGRELDPESETFPELLFMAERMEKEAAGSVNATNAVERWYAFRDSTPKWNSGRPLPEDLFEARKKEVTRRHQKYLDEIENLVDGRKFRQARRLLDEALGKYPESSLLMNGMGVLHHRKGDLFRALEWYERAILADERNLWPVPLYNKACVLEVLGCTDEQEKTLRDALKIHPDYAECLTALGHRCLARDNPWEALTRFKAAETAGDRSEFFYCGLVRTLRALNFNHEAELLAKMAPCRKCR